MKHFRKQISMSRLTFSESTAAVMSGLTAFVGGTALHLPVWALLMTWAFTLGMGWTDFPRLAVIWATLLAGCTFGLIIVTLNKHFGEALGGGQFSRNVTLFFIITAVVVAMMVLGRTKLFGLVPGMFLGVAAFLGTIQGGFGYEPTSTGAAWVCALAMVLAGTLFAYIGVNIRMPRLGTATPAVENAR
jgi:hypothetical protein